MDKYRLAICEDDDIVRKGIRRFCEETLAKENINYEITEFSGSEELENTLQAKKQFFDLLILDIMLGERNGMELAKKIRIWDEDTSIIFVTGCEEYMEMGYDVQAAQFLVKPFIWDKLRKALLRDYHKRSNQNYIVLQKGKKFLKLLLKDFLYAETDGQHGVWIYFAREMENFPLSLAQVEEQADSEILVRCHNSYLVNIGHIQRLNTQNLILDNGQELPVSRTYLKNCREMLIAYINR